MSVIFILGLTGSSTTFAATSPSLGAAATYSIVSETFTNSNTGTETAITGNVCYTTGPATAPISIDGTISTPCDSVIGIAQNDALADLNGQSCDSLGTNVVLSGTYVPGCYFSSGTMDIAANTTITLDGAGTYIFRAGGALTTGANSKIELINGANASDIFWTPVGGTTLGANSSTQASPTFYGNIFRGTAAGLSITLGEFVHLEGRLLAYGSTVTTNANTITVPTIASSPATLHVVKTVINDDGGTATASDFTMNVTGTNVSTSTFAGSETGVEVTLDAGSYEVTEIGLPGYLQSGSVDCSGTIEAGETKTCTITNNDIAPQLIVNKIVINDDGGTKVISNFPLFVDGESVESGVATTTTIGLHTVSETTDSGYTSVIGGDCAADGTITLELGDIKTCTITNDDIASTPPGGGGYSVPVPPIIALTKVPNPLALPNGPGMVEYTYTLRNIGTVPVRDITMVGDTCSPITLISGDTNADGRLDVNETWVYTCSTTLAETHTNIVTATGWANGISATDIAKATVVVGVSVIPPLIHVTKVPNPLVLSARGGMVTYTYKVTNPGTASLSNIHLTDDKCSSMRYISGDINNNSRLESNETWTYTCLTNLTQTIVNTASVSGEANGLTARDFAIAAVIVSNVPGLPSTGLSSMNTDIPSNESSIPWSIIIPAGILAILTSFYLTRGKRAI